MRESSFLERKDGRWRVSIGVPKRLRSQLGTRLKRALHTDCLATANRIKGPVIAEFRALISSADPRPSDPQDEALAFAARLDRATSLQDHRDLEREIAARAEVLNPQVGWIDEAAGIGAYDRDAERAATEFLALARRKATPFTLHHPSYIEQSHNAPKTKRLDELALSMFARWCKVNGLTPTVQAITKRVAIRYADGLLAFSEGTLSPVTAHRYVQRLSKYWRWLTIRELADTNVWADLSVSKPREKHDELERAFTDAEVTTLLGGKVGNHMHDLMRIGALTGARLDAIVDLKVGDTADGLFRFKPQKKERKPRFVPIHSALAGIVERRREGKGPSEELFPEWTPLRRGTKNRTRSSVASITFTNYRRRAGVDETVEGKRRALTNFHSFRRWFITKAEQADQPEGIIAAVVGHKRKGMTLGLYSAGPLMEQAKRCVEAVRLP